MYYIYLIKYRCGSCSRENEFTGSFFYYADKKISDRELEDAKKTIREISDRTEDEARQKFMTNILGIRNVELSDAIRYEVQQEFLTYIVAIENIGLIE